MIKRIIFLLLVSAGAALAQDKKVLAQDDSLIIESKDTVLLKTYARGYDPMRATLLAAIVPGLGQIYTKKYWKLPLVYGGLYAAYYGYNFYNTQYQNTKTELFYNLNHGYTGDNQSRPGSRITTGSYRSAVNYYLNKRDLMIGVMFAVYVLQIIDAHVDAHLKEFDLNPSLQVSIEPRVSQSYLTGNQTGVSVVFKF